MALKLRKLESNASNDSQFEVETRKIWLIEARLRKEHAIIGLSLGQIVFGCLGSIFGPLFGLFLWQLGPLCFFLSLTISLVVGLFW